MTKSAITPYPLRLDPELRKRLEHVAKHAGRSLQAEISARLEQSLEDDIQRFISGGSTPSPPVIQIDNLAELIAARVEERMRARNQAVNEVSASKNTAAPTSGRTTKVAEPGEPQPIVKTTPAPTRRMKIRKD